MNWFDFQKFCLILCFLSDTCTCGYFGHYLDFISTGYGDYSVLSIQINSMFVELYSAVKPDYIKSFLSVRLVKKLFINFNLLKTLGPPKCQMWVKIKNVIIKQKQNGIYN